jgi:mannitol/fructose-specific phosphotransferase system IIA component (Ntr-type)
VPALALRPEVVAARFVGRTRDAVFAEAAARLSDLGLVGDGELVQRRLVEREALGSTQLPGGLAIPHCKLEGLKAPVVLVAVPGALLEGGGSDGQPVGLLFFIVSPAEQPAAHLQTLAAVARWARVPGNVERATRDLDPAALGRIFEG